MFRDPIIGLVLKVAHSNLHRDGTVQGRKTQKSRSQLEENVSNPSEITNTLSDETLNRRPM